MPLDPVKVAAAVHRGLSTVCATCEKYWAARDHGLPGDACLAKEGCGSPIAGDVFHEYVGPMTQFDRFCFVCGNQATHAIRVDVYVRVIGVCSDHIKLVQELKPEGKRAPNVVLISKDGEQRIAEDDKPKKPSGVLKFRGSSDG